MRLLTLSAALVGLMAVSAAPAFACCDCCKKMMGGAAQGSTATPDQQTMPMPK